MSLRRIIPFLVIFILGLNNGYVFGNTKDTPPPFEEIFTDGGYKTVEEALDDFERHFKQQLILPLRVPSLSFTHQFGIFNNLEGEINDSLEVKFISDQKPENHYKIEVRHIKNKLEFGDRFISTSYKLKNGNDALYMETEFVFNMLVFEMDNWQYVLSIDKRVDKVTPETLVQIANSINY